MRFGHTLRLSLAAVVATVATAVFASGAGAVSCVPADPSPGDTATCTFSYTGAAETWVVPAGVTSATFELWGAQGGRVSPNAGGQGAHVQGTLALSPGQPLTLIVGGSGAFGGISAGAGAGGFGGGGTGGSVAVGAETNFGGGGGGASTVKTIDIPPFVIGVPLIVAGGGGGTGRTFSFDGGAGGDSGSAGLKGEDPGALATGGGGGGSGTASAGGAGGAAGTLGPLCSGNVAIGVPGAAGTSGSRR